MRMDSEQRAYSDESEQILRLNVNGRYDESEQFPERSDDITIALPSSADFRSVC